MKKKFLLILIVAVLGGCQTTPVKDCASCVYDLYLWKTAVDTVARANFPDEEYNAVVHYIDYSNAWVTSGNDIHITDDLLYKLSKEVGYVEYLVKPVVVGGFSRPQELEADKLGVGYLQKAGLPPHYFIEVFQIFREESGGKSDEASYFSTHPTTNERIEQIKSFYEKPEPSAEGN